MEKSQLNDPSQRILLAFVVIILFSASFGVAALLISKTSLQSPVEATAEPSPDQLMLDSEQNFSKTQGIKLPQDPNAPSQTDLKNIDLKMTPTPSPTPITTQEDQNLINNPNIELQ